MRKSEIASLIEARIKGDLIDGDDIDGVEFRNYRRCLYVRHKEGLFMFTLEEGQLAELLRHFIFVEGLKTVKFYSKAEIRSLGSTLCDERRPDEDQKKTE